MSAKSDGTLRSAGYQILEQLYSGSRTQVYRAVRECDRLPVVIKLLKREYPTFSELVQFRNQYAIAHRIVEETHRGKLISTSVLGQETEFVITLPVKTVTGLLD